MPFKLADGGVEDEESVDSPASKDLEGEMFSVEEVTIEPLFLQGSTRLYNVDRTF